MSVVEIKAAALALQPEERAELMDELAASFDEPAIEEAWLDEARRRIAELDQGKVRPVAAEEVFARGRKILGG